MDINSSESREIFNTFQEIIEEIYKIEIKPENEHSLLPLLQHLTPYAYSKLDSLSCSEKVTLLQHLIKIAVSSSNGVLTMKTKAVEILLILCHKLGPFYIRKIPNVENIFNSKLETFGNLGMLFQHILGNVASTRDYSDMYKLILRRYIPLAVSNSDNEGLKTFIDIFISINNEIGLINDFDYLGNIEDIRVQLPKVCPNTTQNTLFDTVNKEILADLLKLFEIILISSYKKSHLEVERLSFDQFLSEVIQVIRKMKNSKYFKPETNSEHREELILYSMKIFRIGIELAGYDQLVLIHDQIQKLIKNFYAFIIKLKYTFELKKLTNISYFFNLLEIAVKYDFYKEQVLSLLSKSAIDEVLQIETFKQSIISDMHIEHVMIYVNLLCMLSEFCKFETDNKWYTYLTQLFHIENIQRAILQSFRSEDKNRIMQILILTKTPLFPEINILKLNMEDKSSHIPYSYEMWFRDSQTKSAKLYPLQTKYVQVRTKLKAQIIEELILNYSDKKRLNELLCLTEENDEMIRQEKREEKELIDMNCKISDMNYRLRIIQVKLKQRKQIIMEAMRENAKLKIGIRLERDEIDKIRKSFPNFGKQSNIGTRINNVENRVNELTNNINSSNSELVNKDLVLNQLHKTVADQNRKNTEVWDKYKTKEEEINKIYLNRIQSVSDMKAQFLEVKKEMDKKRADIEENRNKISELDKNIIESETNIIKYKQLFEQLKSLLDGKKKK